METPKDSKKALGPFIRAFLMPTLVGKFCILYFGLNYTDNPGEGYGYGLVASILFTLTMLGLFLYKYRNTEEL